MACTTYILCCFVSYQVLVAASRTFSFEVFISERNFLSTRHQLYEGVTELYPWPHAEQHPEEVRRAAYGFCRLLWPLFRTPLTLVLQLFAFCTALLRAGREKSCYCSFWMNILVVEDVLVNSRRSTSNSIISLGKIIGNEMTDDAWFI